MLLRYENVDLFFASIVYKKIFEETSSVSVFWTFPKREFHVQENTIADLRYSLALETESPIQEQKMPVNVQLLWLHVIITYETYNIICM